MPTARASFAVLLLTFLTPAADAGQRVDGRGDPLPDGAIARIGTTRWRTGESCLLFTSDGRFAVVNATKPWLLDASTGKLVRRFDEESYGAFLMPDDRTLIVTGSPTSGLRFIDIETGKVKRRLPIEGYQCSWSKDGKRMASLRFDEKNRRTISVWDLETGKVVHAWDKPFGDIQLSPDGKTLALSDNDFITLFDASSGAQIRRWASGQAPVGRTSAAKVLLFSPDGKILASAENHRRISLWDPATGKIIVKPKLGDALRTAREGPVTLAFSRDGRYLAAGESAGALYIWDLVADELVHSIENAGHGLAIYVLDFTPDGKTLISQAHHYPSARLWDVATGKEISPPDAIAARVDAIAFSPDGKTLAAISPGDSASLWDVPSGKLLRRANSHRYMGLNFGVSASFAPDGRSFAMSYFHYVAIWNTESGIPIYRTSGNGPHDVRPGANTRRLVFASCSIDQENLLAILIEDPMFKIMPPFAVGGGAKPGPTTIGKWNTRTDGTTPLFRVESNNLRHLYLSPDRKIVAGIGMHPNGVQTNTLFAWNLQRGGEMFRIDLPEASRIEHAVFSADSRCILISTSDRGLIKHKHDYFSVEVASGKLRRWAEHKLNEQTAMRSVVAHENLVAINQNESIYLIDPIAGKKLRRLKADSRNVTCLAISRDGKYVAAGSDDTTVLIWDIADLTRSPVQVRLTDQELDDVWGKLRSDSAETAYHAIGRLRQASDQSVAYLKTKLHRVPAVPEERIERLVKQLNSKLFAEREQAMQELSRLEDVTEIALLDIVKNPPSLETRRRAEDLLRQLRERRAKGPFPLSGELLRDVRAVEALERIGTPEAERLLKHLASGSPPAILTRMADDAQARLQSQRKK